MGLITHTARLQHLHVSGMLHKDDNRNSYTPRPKAVSCFMCRGSRCIKTQEDRLDVLDWLKQTLFRSRRLWCCAPRAEQALAISSGNGKLEHFSSTCDSQVCHLSWMSWHVTADFPAEMLKSRCLGGSWRLLAIAGTPWHTLSILPTFPISPSLLHPVGVSVAHLSCHPNNAHTADMTCFKKADTRMACSQRLGQLRFRPEGPYVFMLCNIAAKSSHLPVETP